MRNVYFSLDVEGASGLLYIHVVFLPSQCSAGIPGNPLWPVIDGSYLRYKSESGVLMVGVGVGPSRGVERPWELRKSGVHPDRSM